MKVEFTPEGMTQQSIRVNGGYLGELYQEVDGYWVWAPVLRGGYLDGTVLRQLADQMDKLNQPIQEQYNLYVDTHAALRDPTIDPGREPGSGG